MGSADKFCLRWNDFESNISLAFRELRDDSDFFDVTLASEDDRQIQAHKVILSACSPFFRKVLKRNPHANPLLYLKGVRYNELVSILNFMYHGEVNVAQDELNSFLAVAEELSVKGLTTTTTTTAGTTPARVRTAAAMSSASAATSSPPAKRPRRPPPPPPPPAATTTNDDADQGDRKQVEIKMEPRAGNTGGEGEAEFEEEEDEEGEEEEEFDEQDYVGPDGFEQSFDDGDYAEGGAQPGKTAGQGSSAASSSADGVKAKCKIEQPYEILKDGSRHRTDIYLADGFGYVRDYVRPNRIYLKCRLFKSKQCKGRGHIDENLDKFFQTMGHICGAIDHVS